MNKKTFFKIVVISSVVLITGGILIVCNKKKVEQTTEKSTESVIETSIEDYKFIVPEGFEIKSEDKNMQIYTNEDTSLTFYVDSIVKDYDEYSDKHVYDVLCHNWTLENGKVIDYVFSEEENGKKALLSVAYKGYTENFIQYIACYIIPKDNKLIMIITLDKCTSVNDVDLVIELTDKVHKDFESINQERKKRYV
ncbi:MAG: hypothetical protein J6Y02_11135 [Pseudobutyrivibrio sp.]|nr:hypothetical protein [Pseudobutyrivibrio sp.]